MAIGECITAARLREILHYDPETGLFAWKLATSKRTIIRSLAGHANKKIKYIVITIYRRHYLAQRLAWLYMTGEWPKGRVDHKDLDRTNNRWVNLREATSSENKMNRHAYSNNTSGLKGVSWHGQRGKWRANIAAHGVQTHLGVFDCPAAAYFAYVVAANEKHGEFARHS